MKIPKIQTELDKDHSFNQYFLVIYTLTTANIGLKTHTPDGNTAQLKHPNVGGNSTPPSQVLLTTDINNHCRTRCRMAKLVYYLRIFHDSHSREAFLHHISPTSCTKQSSLRRRQLHSNRGQFNTCQTPPPHADATRHICSGYAKGAPRDMSPGTPWRPKRRLWQTESQ